jgi:porin
MTRSLSRFRSIAAACGLAVSAVPAFAQAPAAAPAPVTTPPGGAATELLTAPAQPCPCPAADAAPTPPAPPPYGGPLHERLNLTGDWFGTRSSLRDHGITWDLSTTNFYQGVTTGGLDRTFLYGGRADYLVNINGEKAGLWKGLFIDLHGETNYGQSANTLTGALMPVNTAALFPSTDTPITALTGVKLTQALSESFVVFAGKINTLDGFNQPFTGGARGTGGFMNVGLLAPVVALRTIPYSTFGAGFAVLAGPEPVASLMVLDPNNTPTVSGFDTFFNRGVSMIGLVNLPVKPFGRPGHQGFGFTYSNSRYASLDDLPFFIAQRLRGEFPPLPQETGSWSVFYMFDQALYAAGDDPKQSWGVFGNLGIADENPSPFRWAANLGFGGASPLPGRKLDTFGVGYYYVGISNGLRNFAPRLVPLDDEQGVELFYNIGITPWCHVTPDLQVIIPARERVDTAVVFGVRAKIDF